MGNQESRFTSVEGGGVGYYGTDLGVEYMSPSSLRFTHSSIKSRFQDGHSLEETFRQLLYDEVRIGPGQMPPLVAMQYNGYWFVVRGNRRLYVLQKLEEVGKITTVKVKKRRYEESLFTRQFTSPNMGRSIRIRGDPSMEEKIRGIVQQWRGAGKMAGEDLVVMVTLREEGLVEDPWHKFSNETGKLIVAATHTMILGVSCSKDEQCRPSFTSVVQWGM